jgi:hypothetical protein
MGYNFCSSASEGDPHLEAWEGVGEDTERSYSAKSVRNIAERLREKEKKRGYLFRRQVVETFLQWVQDGIFFCWCGFVPHSMNKLYLTFQFLKQTQIYITTLSSCKVRFKCE